MKEKHLLDYFLCRDVLVAQQKPEVCSEFPQLSFSALPRRRGSRLGSLLPLHWPNSLEVGPKAIGSSIVSATLRETLRERKKERFDRGLLGSISSLLLELSVPRARVSISRKDKNGLGRSA